MFSVRDWLAIDESVYDENGYIAIENAEKFDGIVLDSSGHIDRYSNVDYFVGSSTGDVFFGGDGDEVFNSGLVDSAPDEFDLFKGGNGYDTLLLEAARTGRGLEGLVGEQEGHKGGQIDFTTIEVALVDDPDGYHDHFRVTGEDFETSDERVTVDTLLHEVERIDLREYNDVDPAAGSQDTEVYVIDSYEYWA